VAKFGKDQIYRTKVIVRKPVWTPARHTVIALWKGNNPIYLGVIRSKVKVTVTINIIFETGSFPHDNFSSVYWIFTKLDNMIPLWKGKNPIYFRVITRL
jgi:hypothetical protein